LERWDELVEGLAPLLEWRMALRAVVWSVLTWVPSIATQWCVILMFQPAATPVEATFMLVVLAFAVAVPSSPGFIGVYQLAGQQALVLPFGDKYGASAALAVALTGHLLYWLTTTGLGVIGLWWFGTSLSGLARAARFKRSPEVPAGTTDVPAKLSEV
jgi:glycosyltransferase 2 family protein